MRSNRDLIKTRDSQKTSSEGREFLGKLHGDLDDSQLASELEEIDYLLSINEVMDPDVVIDKQIIAAANRELNQVQKIKNYRSGFLHKFSLPLYISAGFVFTVVAFTSLWPSSLPFDIGAEKTSIQINIKAGEIILDKQIPSEVHQIAESLEGDKGALPVEPIISERPSHMVSKRSEIEAINQKNTDSQEQSSSSTEVYTGNRLQKSKYQEKESWARKIIKQMSQGDYEKARIELRDFKEVYPEYPIEEQIKVFLP